MKKIIFLMSMLSFHFLTAQSVIENHLFGGTDADKATCVDISNGGVYVAGHSKSSDGDFQTNLGNYDCFIKRFSDFDEWQLSFGGSDVDYIYGIDKNVVVGASKSNDNDITGNHGNYDYLVVKFDDLGQIVWQKSFGGSDVDKATTVFVDQNDNIWVLGYSKSTDGDVTAGANHGGYDIWLIKLDANGNLLWQKNYGGSNDDKSTDIFFEYSGNFLISGYSKSSDGDLTQNHGNYDYWVFQIDANGDILWQKSYGGSGIDKDPYFSHNSGFMYVAGSSNSNDGDITNPKGNFDIWEFEFNPSNGNMGMQHNLGGTGADFCTGLIDYPIPARSIYSASIAYVCGYSNSDDMDFPVNNGNYDAWIIGIDGYNSLHIGGNAVDKILSVKWDEASYYNDNDLLLYFAGTSKSNDGDFSNQHGNYDAWFLNCGVPVIGSIEEFQIDINTYPNPVTGFLNIKSEQILKISVFDMVGKQIYNIQTPEMPDELQFNVSGLKTGQYVLKVKTVKGEGSRVFSKK